MILSCFHYHQQQSNFWDLGVNDIATLLIALVNFGLLFYVFVYQKVKDSNEHSFIISQINFNLKSEWFKSIILDPNVSTLHDFFLQSVELFSNFNNKTTTSQKFDIQKRLNDLCNIVETRFISLLGCVDQRLEDECIVIIDSLRDELTSKLSNSKNIELGDIESTIRSAKRMLISKLYNFTPTTLN